MTALRISHICQSYIPMISGAALVVRNLAEGAARQGHQVQVLSASDRGEAYTDNSLAGLRVDRVHSFPNPFRKQQRFSIWSRKHLVKLVEFQPDVIHIHDPTIMAKARFLPDVPVVVTIHAYPDLITSYVPSIRWLRKSVETLLIGYVRRLLEPCSAIITPSQASAAYVGKYATQKPHVISNGVDLTLFSPLQKKTDRVNLCAQYGLRPDLPIILHVGRLDIEKNVDILVEIAARVMQTTPAQLLIVGDGLRRKAMIDSAQSLGIATHSIFPGYVSPTGDLPGLYRLASVFVSASEKETQGLVFLEAAASGLPLVTVRATATEEIIENGVNGYMTEIGDIETMALRIKEFIQDPALGRRMGQNGRSFVERELSMQATIREHERLYKSVLKNQPDKRI